MLFNRKREDEHLPVITVETGSQYIEKIFFGCYFPSTVESVFSNNNVSRTRAAFAVNINPQGEADKTPRPYAQDI